MKILGIINPIKQAQVTENDSKSFHCVYIYLLQIRTYCLKRTGCSSLLGSLFEIWWGHHVATLLNTYVFLKFLYNSA